ncbi:MAG: protein kinase [Myxococcota bacterium]|jgi:serine/threonine protein kinase/tetratricopeptide (TPR) repeat protein|nr:protein kinase [Myxococcota bacterium]
MTEQDPLLGRTIRGGTIELQAVIGGGGMGRVYKGVDVNIGRVVAIKVLHTQNQNNDAAKHYFDREAHATGKLWHPNIIQIFDRGCEPDGTLYFVMEYIPGRNLADILEAEFPLAAERVVRILTQILTALEVAHSVGIIHRDLKPENIMLQDLPGNPDFVKVLDFGVAKAVEFDAAGPMTMAGLVMGTPHFMSPEQALGHDIDPRSDLYSVGAMLYQMLTAELPFDGKMVMNVLAKVISEKPEPPSKRRDDLRIDPTLEAICLRAMRKPKEGRFQSAAEFRTALLEVGARPAATPQRAARTEDELRRADLEPFLARSRSVVADSVIDFVAAKRDMDVSGREQRVAVLAGHCRNDGLRQEFSQLFESEVRRHSGQVVSQVGSLSAAIFGYPRNRDDDVRDAFLSARIIAQTLKRKAGESGLCMVISYGDVVVPGGELAASYGSALSRAIQSASSTMGVDVVADDSIANAQTAVQLRATESPELFTPHLEEWMQPRPQSMAERVLPLLGREKEVAALRRIASRVAAGKSVFLVLRAAAGHGKTRMLHLLVRYAAAEHLAILEAPAERMSSAIPGLVLRRLTRAALDLVPTDSLDGVRANTQLNDKDLHILQQLVEGEPALQTEHWLDRVTVAMASLLRSIAQRSALLMVVDDFDALDLVSFHVLSNLAEALNGERIGLVVAGLRENPMVEAFCEAHQQLELAPLSRELVRTFVLEKAGAAQRSVHDAITTKSLGNPRRLALLLEQHRHRPFERGEDLPEDAMDLLGVRLEALPETARRLAAIAGALGESFPLDALIGSCPRSWDLKTNLAILGDSELLSIHEDEDRVWLRFEPSETAAFARGQMMPELLVTIHQRIASYYDRMRKEGCPPDVDFQLARHLDACGQVREAVKVFAAAADKTYAHFGALATLPVLDALLNVADQNLTVESKAFQSVVLKASFYMIRAKHHQDAYDLLERLTAPMDDARRCEHDVLRAECMLELEMVQEAAELLSDAIACLPPRMHVLECHAYVQLATAYEKLGMLREAVQAAEAAKRALAGASESLGSQHLELYWLPSFVEGRVYAAARQLNRAAECFREALEAAQSCACQGGVAVSCQQLSLLSKASEEYDAALQYLRDAKRAAVEAGDVVLEAELFHETARLLVELDRLEDAQQLFQEGLLRARNAAQVDLARHNELWLQRLSERVARVQTQISGVEEVPETPRSRRD